MKRILLLAFAALWLAAPTPSQAQSVTKLCFPATGLTATRTSCIPVDSTNPLPTTATLSAAGGINVTVTNTVGSPAVVTCANCATASVSGSLTVQNVVQWAGGTLGAMANYGTSPGAVLVPGVNAFVTGSSVGSTAGTTSTNALGQMVNCASTTSPSGMTTGNQSYLNCNTSGQLRTESSSILQTSGGWTTALLNGLTTTVTTVKNGTAQLAKIYCYNPNSSVAYVQVFNATPSSVTLGTTTPANSYAIPQTAIGGFNSSSTGDQFSSAISVAATTTVKGLTAPSTALDCNVSFN